MKTGVRFKEVVKTLLTKHENLRDDSGLLYCAIIKEIKGEDYIKGGISLYDHFKSAKMDESLPSISSIARLFTLVQKQNPELRGLEWDDRQKHSKDYKKELGYESR